MGYVGKRPRFNTMKLNPASSDPVNPQEGELYRSDGTARAEGIWQYINATWVQVDEDSSSQKNMLSLENSKFESGLADWVTYDDGASLTPVDGTGGSASAIVASITTSGSEVLQGTRSLKIAKSAADGQGEGVSVLSKTIDRADRGRTLFVSMSYDASHANFSRGDLKLFAYDVTNSQLLAVVNSDNNGDLLTQVGKVTGVITPQSTCTQLRLILHCTSVNALAYDVIIDEVVITPQASVVSTKDSVVAAVNFNAAVAADVTGTYSRTGTTVTITVANHNHKVGHIVRCDFTSGTAVDGNFVVQTVIDSNNFTVTHGTSGATSGNITLPRRAMLGTPHGVDNVVYMGTSGQYSVNLTDLQSDADYVLNAGSQFDGTFALGQNESYDFFTMTTRYFTMSITDPTSNTAQDPTKNMISVIRKSASATMTQNEAGLQTVIAKATTTSTSAISAANPIPFETEVYDNYGAYNPSTGQLTAPRSGYYRVYGAFNNSAGARAVYIYVGGTQQSIAGTADSNGECTYFGLVYANVGQTIDLRPVGGTLTINGDSTINFESAPDFNVFGVQGPVVVGAMTDWVDAGPVSITATTTNPTKGAIVNDRVLWRRVGQDAIVRIEYSHSTAGTAGSGDYLFAMPAGLTIDLSKVTQYTTVEGSGNYRIRALVGAYQMGLGSGQWMVGGVSVYDANNVRFSGVMDSGAGGVGGYVNSGLNGNLGQANIDHVAEFKVPIVGWSSETRLYPTQRLMGVVYLKDVKANGTDGGTFTSGAYQTRTLNTQEGDTGFCSLSSNQFTLQAGTYEIYAVSQVNAVQLNKAKLRNITDSLDMIIGTSNNTGTSGIQETVSIVSGRITLTSPKVFELQHRCQTTRASDGFGAATSFGDSEVYTQVKIEKIY